MKKIVAFFLTLAMIGSLTISTTGCGKTETKKPEKPAGGAPEKPAKP